MQLYYSGATTDLLKQQDPQASLGGYVSVSQVPNGNLNNIFPTISRSTVKQNSKDTRLIVLKNTTGQAVNNVKIWSVDGEYANLKLAGVLPVINSNSQPVFELLQNSQSIPYQATLEVHNSLSTAIDGGTLALNNCIGIWIQRTLDMSKFYKMDGAQSDSLSEDQQVAYLEALAENPSEVDESKLYIVWD